MAKITVDGQCYEVDPANNLLQECLSQGLDLPYFCWHPCMGSVGACRQCAVKQYRDEDDKTGTLVMACMTPVTDGAILSIEDDQAKAFRAGVIEGLMTSHPHDCPVCEEGGECHLQDMTLMSGHNYRRFDKRKVTHRNQDLGPFLNHEMNRCITCYRCVRFYNDYAGGKDLSAQASHHHTYFGRFEAGTLESEFSGNLAEVCPTGVFTDKPFSEHYARKWDLEAAPAVCTGCAIGCNTSPGERYGSLRRIVNRYHSDINGYFLCDRGRFGAHYVNSDFRLRSAKDSSGMTLSSEEASIAFARDTQKRLIGIGSPRASVEANFALRRLVGEDNFYAGFSDSDYEAMQVLLNSLQDQDFNCPSLKQVESADAVLIIGEDVTNTAPRMALSLRQSVRVAAYELADKARIPQWQDAAVREIAQETRSPLCIFATGATRLDDVATLRLNASREDLLEAAEALFVRLSGDSPHYREGVTGRTMQAVEETYAALLAAKKPLIISGVHAGVEAMRLASNIAKRLAKIRESSCDLVLLAAEHNSVGHALLLEEKNSLGSAFNRLKDEGCDGLIVIENDLYNRAPTSIVQAALKSVDTCIVIDQIETPTARHASLVLPSTSFVESANVLVNYEGRAQLSFQLSPCPESLKPVERWLNVEGSESTESLIRRCSTELAPFSELDKCLPHPSSVVPGAKFPRMSHRASGRTAMNADRNVHEGKQTLDDNSVMSFSMEGIQPLRDATVLGSSWAPQWNSNQSISKFQNEVNGALKQRNSEIHLITRNSHLDYYPSYSRTEGQSDEHKYLLQAVQQIFGSDELSARSKPVQSRMSDCYIAFNVESAKQLGATTGDSIELQDTGVELTLVVRADVPDGVALVYPGSSATGLSVNRFDLPKAAQLSRLDKANSEYGLGVSSLVVDDRVDVEVTTGAIL